MEKNKLVTVYKNNEKVELTYDALCKELGYIAEIYFVDVTKNGSITWTGGKADEIMGLKQACILHGYKMKKSLANFHY